VNLDTVNTKLGSVRERIMELQKREKDLSEQKAMMEDAATMKIIKKHKISPEQLQYLEQLSEDEILFLLEEKNKKNVQKTEIKEILTDEKEEIE
jgi:UDP-3-O-[3-hydroxymyristoyl] glucosamine N-acyltransferase